MCSRTSSLVRFSTAALCGVLGAGLGTMTPGCIGNGSGARRTLLQAWGDDTILPLYAEFEAQSARLHSEATSFCDSPNAERLTAARDAWWTTRTPWKAMEVFTFGPFSAPPLRLGPKIDFWPARPDDIEELLLGADSIVGTELGASRRGLPVIEYLLHNADAEAFVASPRRCEYLLATTEDLALRATEMVAAWSPEGGNYLATLTGAAESSEFENTQMALSEVVNRMAFTVENIRSDKLGRPVGTTTGGSPQPDKSESFYSNRSLEDIRDNLAGIERLLLGTQDVRTIGLNWYLRARGHDRRDAIITSLSEARAAIDAIPEPLSQAVIDNPEAVLAAIDVLAGLQRLIQVDIIGAISLTPSFNDNDGD